ncbi:MAG: hypothetical protein PHR35_18605 [Kiritimatiellae bacterium]|nr:hypothetical protein [Kiritimatiellia bacterium]
MARVCKPMLTGPSALQKGYYVPLVLSNGLDFCQLDHEGSMSFKDHIKGYMSYWYRKGRPFGPDPAGLVKLTYEWQTSHGPVEVGDFRQGFDPVTRTATTRVWAHGLELEVECRLTADSTLIERYTVIACADRNGCLRLGMEFPDSSYSGKPIKTIPPRSMESNGAGAMRFDYAWTDKGVENQGEGRSRVELLSAAAHFVSPSSGTHVPEDGIFLHVAGLANGDRVVRTTTLKDSLNGVPAAAPQALHSATFTGDEAVSNLLALSAYVCEASLHPNGSCVSALAIPNGHGMATYWDVWFVHYALLLAGRADAAMRIVAFWDMVYEDSKRTARDVYQVGGARFGWALQMDGSPRYHAEQIHNNLVPVFTIWAQHEFTGDVRVLTERYELMLDCLRFVVQHALRQEHGSWQLKELIAVDESWQKKRNELLTAVASLKAARILKQAATVLGREPDVEVLTAETAFSRIVAQARAGGVWQAYDGATTGTWASMLAAIHFPDPKGFGKAAAHALEGCAETDGLGIGHTSRMRCATFPWVEGIFAWAMARNQDPRAFDWLRHMMGSTNFHGGLPEYVWRHGEPSRDWFVAAHAVFVIALRESLVQTDGDTLRLLPLGLDSLPWEEFNLRGWNLPGGGRVSMSYKKGRPLELRLDSPFRRHWQVEAPGVPGVTVELEPGRETVREIGLPANHTGKI